MMIISKLGKIQSLRAASFLNILVYLLSSMWYPDFRGYSIIADILHIF